MCTPVAHGAITGFRDGACAFRCDRGFYPTNGTCAACASAPPCSAGYYVDTAACDAGSQSPPNCSSCQVIFGSLLGPLFGSLCGSSIVN